MLESELIRFENKIHKTKEGCWEWSAALNKWGYGRFKLSGKTKAAHRVAYEHWVSKIPDGLHIDHLCRNRKCVNPEHLEAVTQKENTLRGQGLTAAKARQMNCDNGHIISGENLMLQGNTSKRRCRACYLTYQRRYDLTRKIKKYETYNQRTGTPAAS